MSSAVVSFSVRKVWSQDLYPVGFKKLLPDSIGREMAGKTAADFKEREDQGT